MTAGFIHLNVHTQFSLQQSIVRIAPLMDRIVQQSAEHAADHEVADLAVAVAGAGAVSAAPELPSIPAIPAIALTDLYNLFALVKFYRGATANGLKPLIGVDARISLPSVLASRSAIRTAHSRVILFAQNDQGYKNLTRLVSRSYQEGQLDDCPVIQRDWLFENNQGLLVLSGGVSGELGLAAEQKGADLHRPLAEQWCQTFGDRFYLELQRTARAGESRWIDQACELAGEFAIAPVATNDVCFLDRDDFTVHETRLCIQQGYVLADSSRPQTHSEEQYLKSPEEMHALFADLPDALSNTVEIARRCNLDVSLGSSVLPDFPVPEGMDESSFFRAEAQAGLDQRLQQINTGTEPMSEPMRADYQARLERELGVIIGMEFPGYFLIVADFIRWARENEVPVGPGRGSGAGSLVAYALGITDLDPLQYDLLFERFLNPERVSMPDFDIDFCMDGRDRVIQYVSEKYGEQRVSQIITYGTMAAKAVVRDVGRVMSHPYGFVDRIAKMVPFEVGMTLKKALAESEELRKARDTDEEVSELLDMALALEGLARNAGKHAGGVVIAPTALTDFTPLYCEPDGSSLVTQFDKDDAEAVGLVKFDFLGLRTLTIIENAVRLIGRDAGLKDDEKLDISAIALDDAATYELLQRAETTAVFQLESPGMKRLIERLRPDNFEDIIALVALYRPGPLQSGMVDDFIDRKHGRKNLAWPHEDYQLEELRPTLEPTYGVILYQEQVIQIAQTMAGFTLGRADLLRRAMGKKKPEEMAKQRQGFLDGCDENDIDRDLAGNIFDLVEKFAGYGFNKSHSAAYALLSYQTAWLKTHYPAAFMCAVLSADMDNTDKVVGLIEECAALGIKVRSPNINTSQIQFDVIDKSTISYGLGAIKGLGEAALAEVLAERESDGSFKDLQSLCRRMDSGTISRRILEALIRCGAADDLGENRASMFENLAAVIQAADQHHKNQASGQQDLFGLSSPVASEETVPLVQLEEWQERVLLRHEKETLGLYLSGHPIAEHLEELARFTSGRIGPLCERVAERTPSQNQGWRQRGVPVLLAGLIIGMRFRDTQHGRIAIVTLDDRSGRVDAVIDSELIESSQLVLKNEEVLVVEGELSVDDFNGGFRIRTQSAYDLAAARERFARGLLIQVNDKLQQNDTLEQMFEALKAFGSGSTPVSFTYNNGKASARIRAGNRWLVKPDHQLLETLDSLSDGASVELIY